MNSFLSTKHGDRLMLVSKGTINKWIYNLIDHLIILRNNNCISFYDIHCRLRCFWVKFEGWKKTRACIMHRIGVALIVLQSIHVYLSCWWLYILLKNLMCTHCHLFFINEIMCIAPFDISNLYIGIFRVCCKCMWFLVWMKGSSLAVVRFFLWIKTTKEF